MCRRNCEDDKLFNYLDKMCRKKIKISRKNTIRNDCHVCDHHCHDDDHLCPRIDDTSLLHTTYSCDYQCYPKLFKTTKSTCSQGGCVDDPCDTRLKNPCLNNCCSPLIKPCIKVPSSPCYPPPRIRPPCSPPTSVCQLPCCKPPSCKPTSCRQSSGSCCNPQPCCKPTKCCHKPNCRPSQCELCVKAQTCCKPTCGKPTCCKPTCYKKPTCCNKPQTCCHKPNCRPSQCELCIKAQRCQTSTCCGVEKTCCSTEKIPLTCHDVSHIKNESCCYKSPRVKVKLAKCPQPVKISQCCSPAKFDSCNQKVQTIKILPTSCQPRNRCNNDAKFEVVVTKVESVLRANECERQRKCND